MSNFIKKKFKTLELFLIVLLSLVLFYFSFSFIPIFQNLPRVDFLQYYSAAKLTAEGVSPYDQKALKNLEHQIEPELIPAVIYMYNPPVLVPLIYVLSFLDYESARALWSAISITVIILSIKILLKCFEIRNRYFFYTLLFFLASFEPFYAIIFFGQISFVLLLCFSAHLYFLFRTDKNPPKFLLSGASLGFMVIKPHILTVYLFLLLFKLPFQKFFLVILGMILIVLSLSLTALIIRPEIFSEYLAFISNPPIFWQTPTVGSWLQYFLNQHTSFIRLLPSFLAALVLIILTFIQRGQVNDLKLLIYYSPLCFVLAPYVWTFDYCLLLPSLILFFDRIQNLPMSKSFILIFALLLLSGISLLIPNTLGQQSFIYYPIGLFLLVLLQNKFRIHFASTFEDINSLSN